MLAPTALFLGAFYLLPLAAAARGSFYAWDLLTPPTYVGLGNYRALLASGELLGAALRTLGFSALVVSGSMVLGLGFAVALDRPGRLYAFVRGAVFSSYVVSWVAVALLWMALLDQDAGLVGRATSALGLAPRGWLGDPSRALIALALVSVWKIAGYAMVIFLAGLQDVPPALLEAAALDGAGPLRRFAFVTWPLLRPSAAFVATTSLILSFQTFDIVRVMTQGGPVRSTTVLAYAIYEQIFLDLRVGRASALATAFFALLVVLAVLPMLSVRARRARIGGAA